MAKKVRYEELNREEIISEITKKKEFSDLPRGDVEKVYAHFENEEFVRDKIRMSRELLMKMYTVFVSDKLLNVKDKDALWFLNRHKSTKERLAYYEEVYKKILSSVDKDWMVIDFGCGVNGFSYEYFHKVGYDVDYLGIEPVGQLVDLQNNYFEKNKIYSARCVKASLFDLERIKKEVSETKSHRIGFFFKVMDSLEMLKRDYSKEVLKELVPMFERCVVSWATKSLGDRKKIFATKKWLREFIDNEFFILDEFEIGGENYLVFEKR